MEDLSRALQVAPALALFDFETYVSDHLEAWTAARLNQLSALETVSSCMERYISVASETYSSNPEDLSIMVLTILQLWIALDRIATTLLPMLAEYPPEIPSTILEPLLLRHAKTLDRAAYVETYLCQRHTNATQSTSIFSSAHEPLSFAVRYFNKMHALQDLKAQIEAQAEADRAQKLVELEQKNVEHDRLMREADRLVCTCEWHIGRRGRRTRYGNCRRCSLHEQAANMTIQVHEWPLPDILRPAQAVVFELRCPRALVVWRGRTYQVLRDVGMAHMPTKGKDAAILSDYHGLEKWSKDPPPGRLVFGSHQRSFYASHFAAVHLPASARSVCVKHGHSYTLYDREWKEFVQAAFNDINFERYGTLRLRQITGNPYKILQPYVSHTTHTHNEVIVNQEDCPASLSLHEYLAFAGLRCGPLLQWMNIAREIRARKLTFSEEAVGTLSMQAAWQIGPLEKDGRTRVWHRELDIAGFALVLMREAEELLEHVKANWLEVGTVRTIGMSRLCCTFRIGLT